MSSEDRLGPLKEMVARKLADVRARKIDTRAITPTEETRRRIDRGSDFLTWLLPRLAGDGDDRETTLVAIMAQMEAQYADGMHDAAGVAKRLADHRPGSRDLQVLAVSLAELERVARANPVTALPTAARTS